MDSRLLKELETDVDPFSTSMFTITFFNINGGTIAELQYILNPLTNTFMPNKPYDSIELHNALPDTIKVCLYVPVLEHEHDNQYISDKFIITYEKSGIVKKNQPQKMKEVTPEIDATLLNIELKVKQLLNIQTAGQYKNAKQRKIFVLGRWRKIVYKNNSGYQIMYNGSYITLQQARKKQLKNVHN